MARVGPGREYDDEGGDHEEEGRSRSSRRSGESHKSHHSHRSHHSHKSHHSDRSHHSGKSHHSGHSGHHHHHHHRHHDQQGAVAFKEYTNKDSAIEQPNNYAPRHHTPKSYQDHEEEGRRRSVSVSGRKSTPNAGRRKSVYGIGLEDEEGFFTCDPVAFFIIVAYSLAVAIITISSWCWVQDSHWNEVAIGKHAFPELENETFFSGKYLAFQKRDPHLAEVKNQMLRENRWGELIHIIFMSTFLLLTLFQCAAYVTRGYTDHSKIVIGYYLVFGILAFIDAFFPLLEWNRELSNYNAASEGLAAFARKIFRQSTDQYNNGINNSTAHDAMRLSKIMNYCAESSKGGITFENKMKLVIFKRDYTLKEFQTLGFCTHHKFKIANAILTFIFAFLCVCIPCIYCFEDKPEKDEEVKKVTVVEQLDIYRKPPPPHLEEEAPAPKQHHHHHHHHRQSRRSSYTNSDGTPLADFELDYIQKFKEYILGDDPVKPRGSY